MHSFSPIAALAFAAVASCQTPPGTEPSTNNNVAMRYGMRQVTPNVLLPQALTATQPAVFLNASYTDQYMAAFVDLSIPFSFFNTSAGLAPGLGPNRTTRLHWLQTGFTVAANGSFTSDTVGIAPYGGPMPPEGDIPHTYVLYIFEQPEDFVLPPADAGRSLSDLSAMDRLNFSVRAIADVAGAPVAANYIRVENPNNTASATATGTGVSPSASSTYMPAPFTGAAGHLTLTFAPFVAVAAAVMALAC